MIGWWIVAITGRPMRSMAEQAVAEALVVVDEVEVVRGACAGGPDARSENASGSGNVPDEKAVTSTKSVQRLSSHKPGIRIGK